MSDSKLTALLSNPFHLTDVGLFSAPTLVDIDNDGDLDAIIGAENGNILFFSNTGNLYKPVFNSPISNPFSVINVAVVMGDQYSDIGQTDNNPEFVDIDADGDLDLFIGTYPYGNTLYFENIGNANKPVYTSPSINPFGLKTVGEFNSPTFVDIDSDGDFDAFLGNYPDGNTLYFENIGSSKNPIFANPITNAFGLKNLGIFSSPTFADLDNDGDFDAFIGTENGDTLYFQNIGTAKTASFTNAVANPFGLKNVGPYSSPDFADVDGDGDLDAFIGTESGETFFFENVASGLSQTPKFITYVTTVVDANATETIHRGIANDFIEVTSDHLISHVIFTGDGRNIVKAGLGNDQVYGGAGDDRILGGAGDDILYGYDGNDVIDGGDGNDLISGGFGYDSLDGGSGNDTVDYRNWSGGAYYNLEKGIVKFQYAYTENVVNFENIKTGDGQDYIVGTAGDNVIQAGAGNDTLIGGDGNDTLTGGLGTDVFRFNTLSKDVDIITDFSWRQGDVIQIDASTFGATSKSQFSYDYHSGALSFNASPFDGIKPQTFAVISNRPWGFSTWLDIALV